MPLYRGSKAKERRRDERRRDDESRKYIGGLPRIAFPEPGSGGLRDV
jgi:hypothetical protein